MKRRPTVSLKDLLFNLDKLARKEDVASIVVEGFSKKDLIDAIEFVYKKTSITTNDRIERAFFKFLDKQTNIEK